MPHPAVISFVGGTLPPPPPRASPARRKENKKQRERGGSRLCKEALFLWMHRGIIASVFRRIDERPFATSCLVKVRLIRNSAIGNRFDEVEPTSSAISRIVMLFTERIEETTWKGLATERMEFTSTFELIIMVKVKVRWSELVVRSFRERLQFVWRGC